MKSRAQMDARLASHYSSRPVLVAGGNGFLGRNCTEALLKLGADVAVIGRTAPALTGAQLFCGDLRDTALIGKAVRGRTIVFDFAGSSGPVESNRYPLGELDQELRAQLALFDACSREPSQPLLMFCSSRLVYGRPQFLPVDENHPLAPQSIYAAHKIAAESYLNALSECRGLRYSVIRLSNPYGPYQQADRRGYGIINQFLAAAAAGRPIRIFGEGVQRRDYIYVEDVIRAFLLCAAEPSCERQTFNLGGASSIPLLEAAEMICELAGGTPLVFEPWPADSKAIETGDYATDLRKLQTFFDLSPQVPLPEGLECSLSFYRQQALAVHTAAAPVGRL